MNQLVGYFYGKFLEEDHFRYHGAIQSYRLNCEYLEEIKTKLSSMHLHQAVVVSDALSIRNDSVDLFYEHFWKTSANGVASIAHRNFYMADFEKLKVSSYYGQDFMTLNETILQSPSKQQYDFAIQWFEAFKQENNARISWESINRFFAAVLPGQLSVVIDEHRTDFLLRKLSLKGDGLSWYEKNELLMKQLPEAEEANLHMRSMFFRYLYDCLANPIQIKKQLLFYGNPGTGKTHAAKRLAEDMLTIWKIKGGITGAELEDHLELVQFHPSYTYDDFVEGIKPVQTLDGQTSQQLVSGVFKDFCRKAAKWEIAYHTRIHDNAKPFDQLTVGELKQIFSGNDLLWIDILQQPDDAKVIDCLPPYFFIIDEMNRAELSKIFGEVLYCLDYRGYQGKIKTRYAHLVNSQDDRAAFCVARKQNYFFVPSNVYIIGTLNTIDRNAETLDFAVRRRFSWKHMTPDTEFLKLYLIKHGFGSGDAEYLGAKLKELNQLIAGDPLLGSTFAIGQTYLFDCVEYVKQMSVADMRYAVWQNNLQPLLEEYLRITAGDQQLMPGKINEFANAFGITVLEE